MRVAGPPWTVGSLVRVERGDAILLVKPVYRKAWCLPGGLIGRNEDPAVAAVREVWEETGLRVGLVGPGAAVVDARPRRVDLVFRAAPEDEDAALSRESPEIDDLGWYRLDELPSLAPETRSALDALAHPERGPLHVQVADGERWEV